MLKIYVVALYRTGPQDVDAVSKDFYIVSYQEDVVCMFL